MNGLLVILAKEWRFFLGSDRGVFVLHLFLITSWSMMLVAPHSTTLTAGPLWLVFFSVIISANFANTVFIAERVNGTLEILITSGISRKQILFGKMLFVALTSSCMGLLCIGTAHIWKTLIYPDSLFSLSLFDYVTYLCAVVFTTSAGSFLSLKMTNPRLMHLATLLVLACLVALYATADAFFSPPPVTLPITLGMFGVLFTLLSIRLYESEKILRPVAL